MQGFDPAVHHFRKAGELGDIFDGILLSRSRAAVPRWKQFDAHGRERARKFDNPFLVGNANEGSFILPTAGSS